MFNGNRLSDVCYQGTWKHGTPVTFRCSLLYNSFAKPAPIKTDKEIA
jgi:hypothetical protein